MKWRNYILIGQTIALIVILSMLQNKCQRISDLKNNSAVALDSTITRWKNRYNQQVAEKRAFESENASQLLELGELHGANKRLKEKVKEYKNRLSAAVSHNTETVVEVRTDTVTVTDTLGQLIYSTKFEDKWRKGSVWMSPDSLNLDMVVFNKFDYTIHREKNLFKPDLLKVQATNLNPYTHTNDLSGYSHKLHKPNWSVGPGAGVVFDQNFKPVYGVGFFVNYSLISW